MTRASARTWFRFSVRRLLILVLFSAVVLACYCHLLLGYQQSRRAAKVVSDAGGSVLWSTTSFFQEMTFPSIVQVDLRNCEMTEQEYFALAEIPHSFLLIIDSDIFDENTMSELVEIKHLSGLSLEPDSVPEEAVRRFQEKRPDVIVMVGLNGSSPYREYPRLEE